MFTKPPHAVDESLALVEHLLRSAELIAAEQVLRLRELELYFWSESHPDPFSHRHPLTREFGRWYIHRTGSGYRSGSFKGLDFAFGHAQAHVGILIRAIELPHGSRIEGPSSIVDFLLSRLGLSSPAALDAHIGPLRIWDTDSPLHIRWNETPASVTIAQGPRVGLSLKRLAAFPEMPRYLAKPYSLLTDPKLTRKGRATFAIGLHQQGMDRDRIAALMGLTPSQVEAYLGWYEAGRGEAVTAFAGRNLRVAEKCRLLGALDS